MSLPVKTGLPDNLIVSGGYQIIWAAVDPVTGADVTGVVISKATVQATDLSGGATGLEQVGPFMLVPGPGA